MKRIVLGFLVLFTGAHYSHAQTQKDNWMVGSSIGNVSGTFQSGSSTVDFQLNPKLGYFIADNFVIGAGVQLGVRGAKGVTNLNYGVLPFARYYFAPSGVPTKRALFFGEADLGVSGINTLSSGNNTSTNGMSFSAGPGMAYFITSNVGFETLLKFRGIHGFGNAPFAFQPELSVGFQIYLPTARAKKLYNEERSNLREMQD